VPAESARAVVCGLAGVLVLGVIALCVRAHNPSAELEAAAGVARAAPAGVATRCVVEPRCTAEQALAVAGPACSQAIAQLAAYGMRWIPSGASGRFPRHAWRDERPGTIRYGGDNAEFEDGAGNHRRVRYECDFDPAQRAVVDVRIRPG
jgi:hypothetical protein